MVKRMKTIKLLLFIFASLLAQNSVAQPVSQLTDEPDIGGWHVAYSNEVTENQAAQGYVDSQLSLFNGDAHAIEAWADFMLRQTVALMVHQDGPELADKFTQDDQRAASMFGAATIKKLLRSRTAGSEQINLSFFAFKAGTIERGDKFIPYFALRPDSAHVLTLRSHPAPVLIEQQISEYRENQQAQAKPAVAAEEVSSHQTVQAAEPDIIVEEESAPEASIGKSPALPSAHVWEYLSHFGAEPEKYATYSYVVTGRNGGDKYIELVNSIQGSTASAKKMEEERILIPEEMNIFLIPAINTDADKAAHRPDYEVSKKILTVLSARSKLNADRPGPYIITMYQPISSLKKGNTVTDLLYVDLTNSSKGAIAEVVRVYKQTVLNKRLNGTDKLYSLRLSLLNLAFMTEESIGFAKTASASLDTVFSGGKK
jgi:hypothetical protein